MSSADESNGYDLVAEEYIAGRGTHSTLGVPIVREWAQTLARRGDVLDIGCGSGWPVSQALADEGFMVYGVDASPRMIAAFRARFPDMPSERNSVGASHFFDRTFDGVVAWGLIFLLQRDAQVELIRKVAKVLKPNASFLFTSPRQPCAWRDGLTGRASLSLGAAAYERLLNMQGLMLVREREDEGENHYYFTRKS